MWRFVSFQLLRAHFPPAVQSLTDRIISLIPKVWRIYTSGSFQFLANLQVLVQNSEYSVEVWIKKPSTRCLLWLNPADSSAWHTCSPTKQNLLTFGKGVVPGWSGFICINWLSRFHNKPSINFIFNCSVRKKWLIFLNLWYWYLTPGKELSRMGNVQELLIIMLLVL